MESLSLGEILGNNSTLIIFRALHDVYYIYITSLLVKKGVGNRS